MAIGKEMAIINRLYARRLQTPSTGAEYLLWPPMFDKVPPGRRIRNAEIMREVRKLGTSGNHADWR